MTPAARAAAAIEILDQWEAGDKRAEKVLRDWGRANRYAGSKDRRAVGDLVFTCLRRRRSLQCGHGADGGRGAILGLAMAEGADPDDVFTGDRYAPAPLTDAERALSDAPAPDPVACDHPDWMEAALKASLGPAYRPSMTALQSRASIGLRVNTLKTTVASAAAALAEDGVETVASDLDADALIAPPGARIAAAQAYQDGRVELQDPSSQAAARLAGAAPGDTVLDYCAGGGGKALALAAHMGGRGRLILHDTVAARLAQAQTRADRAGAIVETRHDGDLADLAGGCDLVFVDAPCSGSGSWRRDPEGKWRLTQADLDRYQALQAEIVATAAGFVRPGGRLAYATCSLFHEENDRQSDRILATISGAKVQKNMTLTPNDAHDGFYCTVFSIN